MDILLIVNAIILTALSFLWGKDTWGDRMVVITLLAIGIFNIIYYVKIT